MPWCSCCERRAAQHGKKNHWRMWHWLSRQQAPQRLLRPILLVVPLAALARNPWLVAPSSERVLQSWRSRIVFGRFWTVFKCDNNLFTSRLAPDRKVLRIERLGLRAQLLWKCCDRRFSKLDPAVEFGMPSLVFCHFQPAIIFCHNRLHEQLLWRAFSFALVVIDRGVGFGIERWCQRG